MVETHHDTLINLCNTFGQLLKVQTFVEEFSVNWQPHCLKKRIVHLHENSYKVKQLLVDESVLCRKQQIEYAYNLGHSITQCFVDILHLIVIVLISIKLFALPHMNCDLGYVL